MSQTDQFSVPPEEWPGQFSDLRDQWHLTAGTPGRSVDQRFLVATEVQRKGTGLADSVTPISGEGWEGARLTRDDTEVLVGFATEPMDLRGNGAAVPMALGRVSVTAYAAAAEFRGGDLVRLVVVDGQ
ncbi:MAG: hypothetical protein AB7Y46_10375 [Armatimonadota bacterium]